MLFSILQDPSEYSRHFEMLVQPFVLVPVEADFIRFTVSFVLSSVYGYETKARDDPMVPILEIFADRLLAALTPGVTVILETFPFRMFAHAMMTCH